MQAADGKYYKTDVADTEPLIEQMKRGIMMNLKNADSMVSEDSARHNAFMISIIESCKIGKQVV